MIRRLRRALGGVLVVAAALVAIALGTGWLTPVATHGVSMEPGYHTGDLVVVARLGGYGVGDVAAYRDAASGTTVLHRIVGGGPGGYVFQGDNNESVDLDRPTIDTIIGRQVLHVPEIGHYLAGSGRVGAVTALVAAIGLVLVLAPGRRRGADGAAPVEEPGPGPATVPPRAPAAASAPPRSRRRTRRVVVGAIVLVDLALAAAFAATFVWAPRVVEPPPVPEHRIDLGYSAQVSVGDAYPDGAVRTGDPLFTRLVDAIDVTARYRPADDAAVTVQLRATMTASNGWRATFELGGPEEVTGDEAELGGTLDVAEIAAKMRRVSATTGVEAASGEVVVEATAVPVDGGEPLTASLAFQVGELSWTVRDTPPLAGDEDHPVVRASAPIDPTPAAPRTEGGIPGTWRRGLLAALLGALLLSLVCWPNAPPVEEPPPTPVRVRVTSAELPRALPRVRVHDVTEVDAVALRASQPVLERSDGWRAAVTPHAVYWFQPEPLPPPQQWLPAAPSPTTSPFAPPLSEPDVDTNAADCAGAPRPTATGRGRRAGGRARAPRDEDGRVLLRRRRAARSVQQ